MRAGDRRHRVIIQRLPPIESDVDAAPQEWQNMVDGWWCSMRALGDREVPQGEGVAHWVEYEVRGAYVDGVEPQFRLVRGDQSTLTISEAIDPDGRRRELHLRATQAV